MTDLINLFNNIDRIALSLERIATSLEDRNAGGDNTISVSVSDDTATVEKAKRTRRTKEQIAAAQAQTTAEQAPAFQLNVGQPATTASEAPSVSAVVQPILPEVPVAAQVSSPLAVPVSAPAANPVPSQQTAPVLPPAQSTPQATATIPAPTAITPPAAAPVASSSAENDFATLYQTIAPTFNNAREQFTQLFAQYGLTLPLSHPDNNQLPGAAFRALSPEYRAHLLQTSAQLSAQVAARGV